MAVSKLAWFLASLLASPIQNGRGISGTARPIIAASTQRRSLCQQCRLGRGMKARFQTLDAMRGFSAVTVVLYHSTPLYGAPCTVAHPCRVPFGYLAVDLFFALSGFVIAHSYDRKLAAGMSVRTFMWARMKRLMPIYLVGLAIGLLLPLIAAMGGQGGGRRALEIAAVNGLMLPVHVELSPAVFPFNPPAWSLFFELWVANLLFAAGHRWLRGPVLAVLVLVAAAALIASVWHWGTLDTGYLGSNVAGGFPRVIFSFFFGVALRRMRERSTPPAVPAWLILVVMVGSFWVPLVGGAARTYELVVVMVLYPALVCVGSTAVERRPWIGRALGEASYALYAIHWPLLVLALTLLPRIGVHYSPPVLAGYVVAALAAAVLAAKGDTILRDRLKAIR